MTRDAERRTFMMLLAGSVALTTFGVFQAHPAEKVEPTLIRSGVALGGYDAVAYFDSAKAIKGSKEFTHRHGGGIYRFSSAASRDKFAADPAKYAPQFGGYCAWAVGHGYTAPGDPEAWKIVDGRLYLNYDKSVQKKWVADQSNLIRKGAQNWPNLHK